MNVTETEIDGCLIITSDRFEDSRGWFRESWRAHVLAEVLGRDFVVAQNNHSRSIPRALRGFHAEPWDKLFYVARGTAHVAVADIRKGSPTLGQSIQMTLGDAPGKFARIFVAEGLANAFYCFDKVDYINEVSMPFAPEGRKGIRWNDPDLAIDWPNQDPILSDQDKNLPFLKQAIGL